MRIIWVRRISQGFFLALMAWFVVVSTLGESWWQLRGWPVNWLLELDPLLALTTLLATGTLFAGLLWALVTVALTLVLGRFFCGWVCPLGALNQLVGWLGRRGRRKKAQRELNAPSPWQGLKYYLLIFFLAAAAGDVIGRLTALPALGAWPLALAGLAALVLLVAAEVGRGQGLALAGLTLAGWLGLAWLLGAPGGGGGGASLLAGYLDPIPLVQRGLSLILLPLADAPGVSSPLPRHYGAAWLVGGIFLTVLLLNLKRPRFFCRYLCPLGALFGVLTRWSLARLGRSRETCRECGLCATHCEGACDPGGTMRWHECVLCLNCLEGCPDAEMAYRLDPSPAGEIARPDLSRRGALAWLAAGTVAAPLLRLEGTLGEGWPAGRIRPPGSLPEADFLARCTRCGQCMRICPSNVIHPAALEAGLEGILTPVLNFRLAQGGCLFNCVACGHLCPTGAIRPLGLEERQGTGAFADAGPLRTGLAYVDRGRCLPWAMDRPCIVCQENCPVSPKAITTREEHRRLTTGRILVAGATGDEIRLDGVGLTPGSLGGGDYSLVHLDGGGGRRAIAANGQAEVTLVPADANAPRFQLGDAVGLEVRLQLPVVDPTRCIGCGACENVCPMSGLRAIRVTADNESRSPRHRVLAGRG